MKYEGIDGPVTGLYKGWIELETCRFGNNRHIVPSNGSGVNREDSLPSISEIVITKLHDSSSGKVFTEALQGTAKKSKN